MDILNEKMKPMYFKLLVAAAESAVVASVFGMVDAMMVGCYHGPAGTAALAVFNPVWSFVYSLGILSGIGGSVLFANVFSNIQSAYLRNDGDANLAMKAVLIGGVFNVFGDYFFVFTMDMGILGAGLATGLYMSSLLCWRQKLLS